ncbi:ATP-binding protein [Niabella sp. CC-SYL272]|uniref:ATP-binding protein n=1 Tax=Niabella agricola TaxID=2891571 RepID=UPI001F46ECE7|nr:ATP-binding protein [Niabella agricola]MCF3109554.1 ATP-binding protein [Niabella agricola]
MYENPIIPATLYKLAAKIVVKDNLEGSGILFLPKNEDGRIYIITAKHCLIGKDGRFQTNPLNISVHLGNGQTIYHLTIKDKIIYHESEDIALIIVSKSDLETLYQPIPPIGLISENGGELQTVFYGFPKGFPEHAPIRVNTSLLPPLVDNTIFLESALESETNLTELTVEGFSGSGICLVAGGNVYLLGIVTHFEEWKRFRGVNIKALESLLHLAQLPPEPPIVIETDPSLIENYEVLERNSADVLSNIDEEISNIHIERKVLMSQTIALLENNDAVLISGIAGVGKSTFCKMLLKHLKHISNAKIISFSGAQICRNSTTELLASLNINQQFDRLLNSKDLSGLKIIYIDSGEKAIESGQIEILKDILRLPERYPGLKVILSIRTYALGQTAFGLINESKIKSARVTLELLTTEELAPLIARHQKIKNLLGNAKIEAFIRTPFYLKQVIQIQDEINPDEIDETGLKIKLWDRLIRKDNHAREIVFQTIAIERAKQITPYIPLREHVDPAILNNLLSDNLLVSSSDSIGIKQYAPSHDVFEDWALVRHIQMLFVESEGNLKNCFSRAGNSYAVRRGFRFWLQELYRTTPIKAADISLKILEHGKIEEHWKNEALTALLNSNACYQFLHSNSALLLAGKAALFEKVVHLLRTGCKIVGDRLAEPSYHDDREYLTSSSLLPIGPGWLAVIRFVDENFEQVSSNYFLYSYLLLDWQNAPLELTNNCISYALSLASKLIELHKAKYKEDKESPNDMLAVGLVKLLFRLCPIDVDLTATFIKSSFDFVSKSAQDRSRNRSLLDYHLEDFHEKVIEIVLSFGASEHLCMSMPELMMSVCRFEWIAPPQQPKQTIPIGKSLIDMVDIEEGFLDKSERYFGLNPGTKREYSPASALQTPLLHLLRYHTHEAVGFIIELLNETIVSYMKHPKVIKSGTIKTISFRLSDETMITQFGDDEIWKMYRGHMSTPDLLQSMLMALEHYVLGLAVDNTRESRLLLAEIIDRLYKESKTVATTAIIASVSMAYPFVVRENMIPLFRCKEFLLWDLQRRLSEQNIFLMMEFNAERQKFRDERFASKNLPHRLDHLEHLIFKMSFYEDFHKDVIAIIDSYQQEISLGADNGLEFDHWPNMLFRMDRRNYLAREYEDEQVKGVIFEPVVPKDSKIASDMKKSPENQGLKVWYWCNQILDKGRQEANTFDEWQDYYSICRAISEDDILIDKGHNSPAGISLIGINYYWSKLAASEKEWIVSAIINICSAITNQERAKYTDPLAMLSASYGLFDKDPAIESITILLRLDIPEGDKIKIRALIIDLIHLLPISDGLSQPLFEKAARELWISDPSIAIGCFRSLLKMSCSDLSHLKEREVAISEDELRKLNAAFDYNFRVDYINRIYLDKAFLVLSQCERIDEEGLAFLIAYLAFLMNDTYKKERHRENYYNEHKYYDGALHFQKHFGTLVLKHLDEEKAIQLFLSLIEFVLVEEEGTLSHLTDDSFEMIRRSLKETILTQDRLNCDTNRFSKLWKILMAKTYKSRRLALLPFLLLSIDWKDSARSWAAVDATPSFYEDVIIYLGHYMPGSVVKLLGGIGFQALFPRSIELLLLTINNAEGADWLLNYFAEKYIQRIFFQHRRTIVSDSTLRRDFLSILDIMIQKGSSIAFITREGILSASHS